MLILAFAAALAGTANAIDTDLPPAFDPAIDPASPASSAEAELTAHDARFGEIEDRLLALEQNQLTEARFREICNEEIGLQMAVEAAGTHTLAQRSTPEPEPASQPNQFATFATTSNAYGIPLAPGERLVSVGGVSVTATATAAMETIPTVAVGGPIERQVTRSYSAPGYSVQVERQSVGRRRGPVRRTVRGAAIVTGRTLRAVRGMICVGGRCSN